MFTDVYNRGKHFKPFTSSLFRFVTGFGNKAHFYVCLTVLGTSKTTYKALYFLQYYVLKFKLSKATLDPDQPVWEDGNFGMFRSSCGSIKKRSMAGLPEFTVNVKVVWEPRGNFRKANNTGDLLLYKIVCMLRLLDVGYLSLLRLRKDK